MFCLVIKWVKYVKWFFLFSAFCKCAKEQGLKVTFMCRQENKVLKDCLAKWFYDEEFREECKMQYLQERSEYRRTGLTKKQQEFVKDNSL